MSGALRYDLQLTIVDGTFDLAFQAPGIHPGLFVETSVDGLINQENNTEIVRTAGKQHSSVWNKVLTFSFNNLEPVTPVIIAMSVLRKRSIHQGFKLVGTARFSTSELIPLLNKGPIQRKVKIHMAKHIPAAGTLTLTINLKSIVPEDVDEPSRLKRSESVIDELTYLMNGKKKSVGIASMATLGVLVFLVLSLALGIVYKVAV